MTNSASKLVLSAVVVALLTACGSSGSGSGANPSDAHGSNNGSPVGPGPEGKNPETGNDISSDQQQKINYAKTQNNDGVLDLMGDWLGVVDGSNEKLVVNGNQTRVNLNAIGNGLHVFNMRADYDSDSMVGKMAIYNRPYSVVLAMANEKYIEGKKSFDVNIQEVNFWSGLFTEKFDDLGSATYSGQAVLMDERGAFTYNMNFDEKIGQGQITGLSMGHVDLLPSETFQGHQFNARENYHYNRIAGEAQVKGFDVTGHYEFSFFGPNAEEIAGAVRSNAMQSLDGPEDLFKLSETGFPKGDIMVSGTKN